MKDVAQLTGVSLRTAWARASTDPDHPPLIKHSPRVTVVEAAQLQRYLNVKVLQASERFLHEQAHQDDGTQVR